MLFRTSSTKFIISTDLPQSIKASFDIWYGYGYCPTFPTLVEKEVQFLTQGSAYTNRNNLFAAIEKEITNFVS